MNSIVRHQAGTMIAGQKAGGQFKEHQRAAAAPPSLSVQSDDQERIRQRMQEAAARLRDLDERESNIRRERQDEALRFAGLAILSEHPDATEFVLAVGNDPEDTWELAGVKDAEGEFLDLSPVAEQIVNGQFAADALGPIPGEGLDSGDEHGVEDWPYGLTLSIDEVTREPEPAPLIDLNTYERGGDGRLTRHGQIEAIDDISAMKSREQRRLARFQDAENECVNTEADHDAWNATHDRISELDALYAEVNINRGPVTVGSSEWLAMNNID